MKKRLIAMIIATIIAIGTLGLTACSKNKDNNGSAFETAVQEACSDSTKSKKISNHSGNVETINEQKG